MNTPRLLGIGAILVASAAAGFGAGGVPAGVTVLAGEVRLDGGELVLAPGAVIAVGQGVGLAALGSFPGTDVDLGRGPLDGAHELAHFGEVSGLYRHDGTIVGDDPRFPWGTKSSTRLEFRCDSRPELWIDGRRNGLASPGEPCDPGPLWIRATGEARIAEVVRDGVSVPLTARPFEPRVAGTVLAAGGALSLLFGLTGWYPLWLAPLALFGARVGLPPLGLAWLLVGTAFVAQATANARPRRGLAVGCAAMAFSFALLAVFRTSVQGPPAPPAHALSWVDMGFVTRKVDVIVRNGEARLAARRAELPLVVVLGSSSSRPGPSGLSWPDPLQAHMPHVAVVTLAEGGATSWHMRRGLERLDVRPDACVAYLGHNDRSPMFPGLTIAALERGERPVPGVWSEPVSLSEARENYEAIALRCGVAVVMQEHSTQRMSAMQAYAEMLRSIPTARYLDVSARLAARPQGVVMRDDVHLTPEGDAVVARAVAEVLLPLFPRPLPLPGDGDPDAAVARP